MQATEGPTVDDDDPLELLAGWLVGQQALLDIPGHVTVREAAGPGGLRTAVSIDHRVVCPVPGFDGWRVTTRQTFVPRAHFSSTAANKLKTADHGRGRAIFCFDRRLEDELVAGIAYHIDERPSLPVFVTAIALRADAREDAELARHTLAGALLLKQYVHAVARAVGRGDHVHIELPSRDVEYHARRFGFRRAPRIEGLRVSGVLRRQAALGQDAGEGT
jgi:hypothetical protein